MQIFSDTDSVTERRLIEGLRGMPPEARLARALSLRRSAIAVARVRLLDEGVDPREARMRLAATWIPPDLLRRALAFQAGPAR
jgi:hypothetical protein